MLRLEKYFGTRMASVLQKLYRHFQLFARVVPCDEYAFPNLLYHGKFVLN